MKNFEIFKVSANADKLRQFREEYIRTFKGDIISAIVSKSTNWYDKSNGVYSPSPIGIGVIPLFDINRYRSTIEEDDEDKVYIDIINEFVNCGIGSKECLKAFKLKFDSDVTLFNVVKYFALLEKPQKKGMGYRTEALEINEDIFNMSMIGFMNYTATTTPEDLSRYAEYFRVSDEPYASISEEIICDLASSKHIKYDEVIKKLELSEKAILSLKR